MIELRWATRPTDTEGRDGPIFFTDHINQPERGYMRILQYRYRYPEPESRVNAYPPRDWIWSDWLDVPQDAVESR